MSLVLILFIYFRTGHICVIPKFESSAFAFVCFEISTLLKLEISTLLKLENSSLLLFSEGLKFQALEGLKSNVKTDDSSFSTNWHPQSSFYVISGTLSFKFLTQALRVVLNCKEFGCSLRFISCFCNPQMSTE